MHTNPSRKSFVYAVLALALIGALASVFRAAPAGKPAATPSSTKLPLTPVKPPAGKEIASLAAGCFWSMEAIFEQLKGVDSVEPGYAGGHVAGPSYEKVCSSTTGHAETVHIIFDPKVISYGELLQVMLTLRDPTTLNRQGPDEGPQYRSVIFTHNAEQKKAAEEAIKQIAAARVWKDPIVTTVEPFSNFYRAEDYHRDYYARHPDASYCTHVIAPKLEKLREKFPSKLKKE